jgi:hypothetical protein
MEELLATGLTFLFAFAVSTATSGQKKESQKGGGFRAPTQAGGRDRDQTEGDG